MDKLTIARLEPFIAKLLRLEGDAVLCNSLVIGLPDQSYVARIRSL